MDSPGLFGKLKFYQLLYIVAGIWLLNLLASPVWLEYFRFGPREWIWRLLTHWQPQPMLRRSEAGIATAATAEAD